MNRLVGIKFQDEAVLGQGVGYLTLVTGDIEHKKYEVNYSAERPMYQRFTIFVDDQRINLSQYLSKCDLKRLNDVYFDFRTTNTEIAYVTAQLKDCYELSIEALCS